MNKKWTQVLIVALLAVAVAACTTVQAAPRDALPAGQSSDAEGLPRTVTVVGVGRVTLVPDIAKINLGAQASASTVAEAKAEVDRQMSAITAVLKEMGIADKDIQTSQYSIYYQQAPVMRDEGSSESKGAYRVSNMLEVTVRDIEKAGEVLDAVVEAGANQVYGVSFTVSDDALWQSQARANAMADAKSRAQELAALAEVELGQVLTISEVVGSAPVPVQVMVVEQRAVGGGGIAPGELELSTQVQVTYAIQ